MKKLILILMTVLFAFNINAQTLGDTYYDFKTSTKKNLVEHVSHEGNIYFSEEAVDGFSLYFINDNHYCDQMLIVTTSKEVHNQALHTLETVYVKTIYDKEDNAIHVLNGNAAFVTRTQYINGVKYYVIDVFKLH